MDLALTIDPRLRPVGAMPPTRAPHEIVELHGEIDIAQVPALRERLNQALEAIIDHRGRLIVDLTDVSFCDASGLAVLVGTQRRARRLAISMCLAAPSAQVRKILRITGLDRGLVVHATLAAAVNARQAPTSA